MSRPLTRGSVRGDVLRGIGAFLALGGIVAGVPWLLATLVGWPLPRKVPDVGRITEAIGDSYIPDELLVNVIAVVCWIIWAQLVASIVLEAIGSIRGRSAPNVPLGGSTQRIAGRLV